MDKKFMLVFETKEKGNIYSVFRVENFKSFEYAIKNKNERDNRLILFLNGVAITFVSVKKDPSLKAACETLQSEFTEKEITNLCIRDDLDVRMLEISFTKKEDLKAIESFKFNLGDWD